MITSFVFSLPLKSKLIETGARRETTGGDIRDRDVLKTYTGFWGGRYDKAKIAADGSTVVNIYYDRKGYEMKRVLNYDNRYISRPHAYEAKIYAPDAAREGYDFVGWFEAHHQRRLYLIVRGHEHGG